MCLSGSFSILFIMISNKLYLFPFDVFVINAHYSIVKLYFNKRDYYLTIYAYFHILDE